MDNMDETLMRFAIESMDDNDKEFFLNLLYQEYTEKARVFLTNKLIEGLFYPFNLLK